MFLANQVCTYHVSYMRYIFARLNGVMVFDILMIGYSDESNNAYIALVQWAAEFVLFWLTTFFG